MNFSYRFFSDSFFYSGSEFTVTNIDADELRRSQRRSKRGNLPTISIQTAVSGSQESDDDDDEVLLIFLWNFCFFVYTKNFRLQLPVAIIPTEIQCLCYQLVLNL